MRGSPVGAEGRITYDIAEWEEAPVDGDFLRTPAGTCYRIDRAKESPTIRGRFYLNTTKLDPDAVQLGEPGVWPLHWHPRGRDRRRG